ncbi:MAG TPA: class I SAM-dependent methyltransferase [Allosphingosinicella sp.]|nr:class I SAM-dependent methyltransferase [Allosphingosinicella sp.]
MIANPEDSSPNSGLYASYVDFKKWSVQPQQGEGAVFADLIASAGKSGKLDLLEIGFGNGSFMDWARHSGHNIVGIELIPDLVELARGRGHEAYLNHEGLPGCDRFDAIIAIDVLEHLDLSQFRDFFKVADQVLKKGGVIIGRFPNGDSPFFGRYQYGDYTHDKPLSWRALHQIGISDGFEVKRAVNPRPLPTAIRSRLKQRLAYGLRNLIETVLGFTYFGYRTPMDPNIIVIMGRRSST